MEIKVLLWGLLAVESLPSFNFYLNFMSQMKEGFFSMAKIFRIMTFTT